MGKEKTVIELSSGIIIEFIIHSRIISPGVLHAFDSNRTVMQFTLYLHKADYENGNKLKSYSFTPKTDFITLSCNNIDFNPDKAAKEIIEYLGVKLDYKLKTV